MRYNSSATGTRTPAVPKSPPREVRQSSKLRNVLYEIRGPVAARAAEMERAGVDVLKLNIGNPQPFGFQAPEHVTAQMARSLPVSHGYSDSHGIPAALDAVIARYGAVSGFPALRRDDVFLGNGVSELITMTCQALVDNDDEILIPAPDYPLWTAMVTLAGGTPVHYNCAESDGWNPDLHDMESRVTDRTTAIVVINPNNPTGAVYPPHILEGIADIARRHGLTLLVDEIYDEITYDGAVHTHLAAVAPDVLTLSYSGLSKSSRLAGYRAGWMVVSGPKEHAADFLHGLELMASTRLCPNVPGQHAVATALGGSGGETDYPDEHSIGSLTGPDGRLRRQRDLVDTALNGMDGVSCVTPRGALYAFPRLDPEVHDIRDDERLVMDLLEREYILLVHGTGFNWPTTDHLRIVLLPEERVLATAMERLGNFLSGYRQ